MYPCAHLGGDDAGQCGFAKPGWASKQQVIDCLLTTTSSLHNDGQVFFEFTLTDEFVQRPGTDSDFELFLIDIFGVPDTGVEEFVTHESTSWSVSSWTAS